jgi:hypothetical protein
VRIRRGAQSSTVQGAGLKPALLKTATVLMAFVLFGAGIAWVNTHGGSSHQRTPLAQPVRVLGEKLVAASSCPTNHFCMSGDVNGLIPGTTTSWPLTLINPNPFPIYVTQLSTTVGDSATGCDGPANLTVPSFQATGTGDIPADAITVGPATSSGPGTIVKTLSVHFNDLPTPQDSCLGTKFLLTTNGQAVWNINCINGKQGSVTVSAGQTVCLTTPADVKGGITVKAGGTLIVSPGSSISGGLKSTGGASRIDLCGASVSGGVSISGVSGLVTIGGVNSCPGNDISGGLTLTNNTGGIQVVGNTVSGGITISGNTSSSPQFVESNNVSGGLACAGNNPPLSHGSSSATANTVKGARSGQCAGSF